MLGKPITVKFILFLITFLAVGSAQAQPFPMELLDPDKAVTLLFQTPDATKGSDLRHHFTSFPTDSCQAERQLSSKGEQQAAVIGQALNRLNISATNYVSSTYCRSHRALEIINPAAIIQSTSQLDSICFSTPEIMRKNSDYLLARFSISNKPSVQIIMAHQCNIRFILQKDLETVCRLPGRMSPGTAAVIHSDQNNYELVGCISMEQWRLASEPPHQ